MKIKLTQLCALGVVLVLVSACVQATPIVVIVTPTQQPGQPEQTSASTANVAAAMPTAIPSPTATLTTTASPTSTAAVTASAIPTGPTATFGAVVGPNITPYTSPPATGPKPTFGAVVGPNVTPYVPPATIMPTSTVLTNAVPTSGSPAPTFGAVVGPNYTPPPTFTPGPPPTVPPANVTLPALATVGPSPTPGPVLRSALMGIQIHGYLKDNEWMEMLARSKDLGMGWIKVQVQWKELEPAKGVANELYKAMVLNVQRARLQGFRTMVSIAKAPGWTRVSSAATNEDGPPDNPQDLADFVARFVRDVKPEFLDALEIWNEPNLIREWRGKPLSGAEYMQYFNAAYAAIQSEQKAQPTEHRIVVITAGLAPTSTAADGGSVNDRDWLRQMYRAGLAKIGPDVAVGVHPYGWANPPDATCCKAQPGVTGWYADRSFYFRDTLDDYRQIMVANSHASGKLWVTEFGWATYDGLRRSDGLPAAADSRVGWQTLINAQQQASYVLRAFYMAQQPPYYDFLGPMMLWNLNFGIIPKMIDESREEAGFSLLDVDWNGRPVYRVIKNAPKE
jgi:polysaccharide biosynthesis protein PslG